MNVCFVTSECVPFSKTGGLADVSGSLPKALASMGCAVKVVTPLYQSIDTNQHGLVFSEELGEVQVSLGGRNVSFYVWHGTLPDSDVDVHFVDCPEFYHRPSIYTADADEHERYILLQHAAFAIMQRYGWSPDILHCNDWQSGLMPAFQKYIYDWDDLFASTKTVLTIHNIAYQGAFSPSVINSTGLPGSLVAPGAALEFNGACSFLKGGIVLADAVTTVSPTYANEIQHGDMGAGLDGILRAFNYKLLGILNGIDPEIWSPENDSVISPNYDVDTLEKKEEVKKSLLAKFDLPYNPGAPLFGIVSRLTAQKGFELLQPILATLVEKTGMQLIALGSGEDQYERFFQWATNQYPDQVATFAGYNNDLAHWIEAGADFFIMPSRFEPCGLNQMYSLAYGTIPIVRHTGGLADTVVDVYADPKNGNGISFRDFTPHALMTSILRGIQLFDDRKVLNAIRTRGMTADFSWQRSAQRYVDLYEKLVQ